MIAGANHADMHVNVVSAFPLSPERRAELLKAINNLVGREIPATFSENRDLLSGLHVSVGPWILHANLRDELAYFRESANGES